MSTSGSYALPVAPPLGRVRDEQIQSSSTRVIVANMGNPSEDLAAERARASFDVATMSDVLYGEDLASERRRMAAHLAGDPRFSKVGRYFMTREQRMARSLQMAADIPLAFIELGLRQVRKELMLCAPVPLTLPPPTRLCPCLSVDLPSSVLDVLVCYCEPASLPRSDACAPQLESSRRHRCCTTSDLIDDFFLKYV